MLDYTRKEVRDYIFDSLSAIFSTVPISYVKWDMNRCLTEIGSAILPPERQSETAHRYVLGLYELLDRITTKFPSILFESCSSGGGRFDPGLLFYMPQIWTNDNTDAVERLKIQYGTSLVYPVSAIGAHISAVPNHQVGRITPLEFRGDVAMSGNFGYELDLTKFTDEEKETVKLQVATYKQIRGLVQKGDLYRLKSPFEDNELAWMFISEDKKEALVFFSRLWRCQIHLGGGCSFPDLIQRSNTKFSRGTASTSQFLEGTDLCSFFPFKSRIQRLYKRLV